MTFHTTARLARAFALGAGLVLAAPALCAQGYPTKPIRLVVPYPPGGGTDFFARTVSAKLSENLGQPIVVENRPGAATIIGAEAVAKSAPDGYTILLGDTATFAVNPSLYKKLPYDPLKSFAPISLTGRFALLLVVHPSIQANSVSELIALAKAKPGALSYASPGPGSPHHLAMELFIQRTGISLVHVPYKGAAPAIQDLLGGQIPTMILDFAAGAPQIKAGKIRALAVASPRRLAAMPDLATLAESGLAGYEAWAWQGLVAPANTPREIIAKLGSEYARVINDASVRQKIVDAGIDPLQSSPQELADYIASEQAKWAKVVKDRNITVE
ncbi:MAG: Bug family tripartite tricarboxylate transporter substrate binding protein [Burkholderiales bacterium]